MDSEFHLFKNDEISTFEIPRYGIFFSKRISSVSIRINLWLNQFFGCGLPLYASQRSQCPVLHLSN